jgi:SAM-dependent methyltransferase
MPSEPPAPDRTFPRADGRHVFGSAAAFYSTARPDYPDRVYEILRDRCRLGPSSRVLEIGAGTGLATKRLAESGASVVAVEPNEALADELRHQMNNAAAFEIVVAPFEELDVPPSSFRLVTSATAFHWLDPDVALPKIASALRPGGWLALWWNVFGDPDLPDPFHEATEPILGTLERGPSFGVGGADYALDVAARTAELSDHGFRDVEHEAVEWTLDLDAAQARQLYATYSNIARLPEPQREAILDAIQRIAEDEFGGRVERRMVTPIYTSHV